MKLNFRWAVKKGVHQNGENLYLNRIRVGMIDWNDMRSRSDNHTDNDWVRRVLLPSLAEASKVAYSGSREEARAKTERTVTSWFTEATSEEPIVSTVRHIEFDTLRNKLRKKNA